MTDTLLSGDLQFLAQTHARVRATMTGIDDIVSALLCALVTRDHVLLEGNPGLGKTALVRALGVALGLDEVPLGRQAKRSVGRIQFTPDLMPSDITGTRLPTDHDSRRLEFQKGPIFANLLLADEINRATPKTQSAMLEAMAEFQVTVLGETHPLTEDHVARIPAVDGDPAVEVLARTPFLVLATQNPVEQEGTNPLPEAQLDRFAWKVRMPFPDRETLARIVAKDAGPGLAASDLPPPPAPEVVLARLYRVGAALKRIAPAPATAAHILNAVMASTGNLDRLEGVTGRRLTDLTAFVRDEVRYPLGPRAAAALTRATLAWAAIRLVAPEEPSQVPARSMEALAAVGVPVLRHRMKFDGVDLGFEDPDEGRPTADRQDDRVARFLCLTAPYTDDHHRSFEAAMAEREKTCRM